MDGREKARRPLTYDDRLAIERGLNRGDTISRIAGTIGRAPKVVRGEAGRNLTSDPGGRFVVQSGNICVKYQKCEVRQLCKGMCIAPCRKCRDWLCNSVCPERIGSGCSRLYRFYEAKYAQDLADACRSDARSGIDCDPEAFERAIEVIKAGLARGQSPAHITEANPDKVPFRSRGLYNRLAGAKADTLTKLDLPKAVRYKPRNRSADGGKSPQIPRVALEGRRWSDFCALDPMDQENAVEMDTVVGRLGRDRQCVLTLFMRRIGFQFYIFLPDKSGSSVVGALDSLQDLCGPRFSRLFGIVLADRGAISRTRNA